MNNSKDKYYLGLDMGTGSVGWAVTNDKYEIIKKNGKALWGIRLFESANTAEERRMFRTSRRRTERSKNRIALLQELFAEEIGKVDPGFYLRMKESKYYPEDKRDSEGNMPELPYALFVDKGFTDKDFHKKFPTIYHLRQYLCIAKDEKPDIRLVYLALHHIIKHRGHFLFEGREMSDVTNFDTAMDVLLECAEGQGMEIALEEDEKKEIESILRSGNDNRTTKKQKIGVIIAGNDKQKKALAALIAGCSVKLSELFGDKTLDEEERNKICFSDSTYEDYIMQIETVLADRFLLIIAAKAIYDWAILNDILQSAEYLSEAKAHIYNKHREDLRKLKDLLRTDREVYVSVFGVPGKAANYSAYIGMVKKNGKKVPIEKKCTREDFYSFLKKTLNSFSCPDDKKQIVDELLDEIELGTLLPKQVIRDNGVIPYQLHEKELKVILENAEKFYPFLEEKDTDGYSAADKIKAIFQFRIPYYVGPLNTYHKDKGGHSWSIRKGENFEKIYPWNFREKIDEEESAEQFIRRMTNKCTYLVGEDVLPKESLLYAKYTVLNELNNLRIDGELASVEIKQKIYEDVFKKHQRVTGKRVKDYLVREGIITKEQELSGFDQNFKSSLKAYHDIKQIAGDVSLTEAEQEDIIKDITLFGDSQKMLKKRLQRKYSSLSDKQISQLAGKKYTGWGRFSRAFLEEIESVHEETGEILNIISALWVTNENLMQLLSKKYKYLDEIAERNSKKSSDGEVTYEDVKEMYVSPAVKRPIWQTLKIVREITHIMGGAPERIFVEMAREPSKKEGRKASRKAKLQDLYRSCQKEAPELCQSLNTEDDHKLRSDKLYLYYTQMGRCMYSGEVIDIEDLFTNRYDIDHIYPQSKVMDDSLDNRVLVKRELNSNKSDTFPVPKEYMNNAKWLWDSLLKKQMISKEKYHRLTRRDEFGENELAGFIARQLVETRQSTKAVTQLLNKAYPDSEIVYAKARAVSKFRQDFGFIKVREINDYHHAKDAYLNIVVGNTYYVKFTKDAAWFVRNYPGRTYNLQKMFERETVKRGNEVAWVPGDGGTIHTVVKWMRKNNILFTRRAYEVKGGLFDQQIMKKGKGQVPIKSLANDDRLSCIEKYGGYNKASGAYFMLVESEDKKGSSVRTIEYVPVYRAKKVESSPESIKQYCRDELGLKNPRILLPKIKTDSLFNVDGFMMHLSGRTGKRLVFKGANQLVVSIELQKILKKVSKFCLDYKENKNATISDKMELSDEDLLNVYEEFQHKLQNTVYGKRLGTQIKTLEDGKEKFDKLTRENKCLLLNEILHLFQCQSSAANLSSIAGPGHAGILVLSKDISKLENISVINQSITGFYEQVIDLKEL
ncbi:MAG: type II CRISPR RNA-guided endonuclease Cas9 [Lachnospiraceae bacterium]|nr:type II CRISPR RNA-guided endonuclease Cas9 [Lachnospiraceae bacterium]